MIRRQHFLLAKCSHYTISQQDMILKAGGHLARYFAALRSLEDSLLSKVAPPPLLPSILCNIDNIVYNRMSCTQLREYILLASFRNFDYFFDGKKNTLKVKLFHPEWHLKASSKTGRGRSVWKLRFCKVEEISQIYFAIEQLQIYYVLVQIHCKTWTRTLELLQSDI